MTFLNHFATMLDISCKGLGRLHYDIPPSLSYPNHIHSSCTGRLMMEWNVQLLQDTEPISSVDGIYLLKKKPFTIQVTLPRPYTVQLNLLGTDTNFNRVTDGVRVGKLGEPGPKHCLEPGTGIAEEKTPRGRTQKACRKV